jgi:branched-chain amino acid transport system substrate-binding protein
MSPLMPLRGDSALSRSALGLILLSVACTPMAGQQSPQPGSDVTIGIPLSMTGTSAQEAGLTKQGYGLWLDWANRNGGIVVHGVKHRVRLVYENDNSDPQVSARVTQQMITREKVMFLLGPYGTTNTAAAAAVADRYHVPLVASTAAARQIFTQGFRYVFGVLAPADQYPRALIDMVLASSMSPRPSTIAMLAADDVFSQSAAKATADFAVAGGLQIVFSQTYPTGLTNFDLLMQQAKATNPDMLFNLGHLLESVAVNKAALDVQLDAKLFAYSVGPGEPEFVGALGRAADYVVTVSPWTAEARYKASYYLSSAEYVAAFRKKFHTSLEPSFAVADATAAGVALQAAIEHAQSLDRDKVRNALASLDLGTFFGRIRFDAQGENVAPPGFSPGVVVQIQYGHQRTVWPPQLASAIAAYPTPPWSMRLGLPPAPPRAELPGTGLPPTES